MRRFSIVLFVFTAVAHAPFALALAHALSWARAPAPAAIAIAVSAALVALLSGRLRRARADRPLARWRVLLVEEPWYAHWCALVLTLPLFAISALVISSLRVLGGAPVSYGAAALAVYGAALLLSIYGVMIRRRWVRVRTIDVPIAGLHPAFEGYRIAQLSDLHIGGLWPRESAARWARRVRELDVDLVALTGDYVTSGDAFHHDIAAVLGDMRGRDGVIAVLGNHDYFGDVEPLVHLLRGRGVTVLRNEHLSITRAGEAITIAGVDDTWTRRADVARALAGRDPRAPLIALAHDPQLFPALARGGARLVLAGHTHWGQVAVPFAPERLNLSRLSYRYHAGSYREGDAVLYISPGLGTTGPPVRLGAPPEITVLRLHILGQDGAASAPKRRRPSA